MGRLGIYLKDKLERKVRDIVALDRQNGASASEANVSATCNELIRLGLLVHENNDRQGDEFDLKGYRRDLIRKAAGSREGTVLIATLLSEIYLSVLGKDADSQLENTINMIMTGIVNAEDEAENRHFIEEEK